MGINIFDISFGYFRNNDRVFVYVVGEHSCSNNAGVFLSINAYGSLDKGFYISDKEVIKTGALFYSVKA
jgi:hypothetical protein